MRLTKNDKKELVKGFRERFEKASAAFIAEYRGIKAGEMTELRRKLRDSSVEFKIVRNTLARLAVRDTDVDFLAEHFNGPVAIAFSYSDPALAAKTLVGFAKEQPALKLRLGAMGGRLIKEADIKALAELPPRDVLLSKLVGSLKSPPTGLVGVLSGIPRKLLYALNAIKEAKEKAGAQG